MATVGIHLVWTSYGTWPPGDQRGHWSALFDFYGNLIERGGKLNRADLATRSCVPIPRFSWTGVIRCVAVYSWYHVAEGRAARWLPI